VNGSTNLCVAGIRLAAVLTAVSVSRAFVRQTLTQWQLAGRIDSAELIVSELVTNAVKETGITDPAPTWEAVKAHHVIGVQLRLVEHGLYVEVWDSGKGVPTIAEHGDEAEGGRGLFLVECVSEKWGVQRPAAGGKVVWAELSTGGPAGGPLPSLPSLPPRGLPQRESGGHGPVPGEELDQVDLALMQRVLDGLRASLRGDLTEVVAV
jgi:anti-sigma regulatory factor (Ser/Thr protein kinase)